MNKRRSKKQMVRSTIITWAVMSIVIIWLTLVVAGTWSAGDSLATWTPKMSVLLSEFPQSFLHVTFNEFSLKFAAFGLIGCIFILLFMMLDLGGKYRNGEEFGSAELVDAAAMDKRMAAPTKKNAPNTYTVDSTKKVMGVIPCRTEITYNYLNRQISQHLRLSMDIDGFNNNMLVFGGSGAGKTYRLAKPILLGMNGSYVITDPKGELLKDTGGFLKKHGYQIKVLNFTDTGMAMSNHYNPFEYIKAEKDVIKLITDLIKNTKGTNESGGDFWEKAEGMFLQSLFYYVWLECPKEEQNFPTVLRLMTLFTIKEDSSGNRAPNDMDKKMDAAERRWRIENGYDPNAGDGVVCTHPAVVAYHSSMDGACDTVRCIIQSANARLANLKPQVIQDLLSDDEFNFEELGRGVNLDGKTKTAVFCVIPETDTSFNFIVSMMYSQMFAELYSAADTKCDGKLPISVTFLLDEFANVPLPKDFLRYISTMRSKNISSIVIVQNKSQLYGIYKDDWEQIPGNCSTLLYLGGNEQGSHKYFSDTLGKETLDKKNSSDTKGKQGSHTISQDRFGRALMEPDEVGRLPRKKCIVILQGEQPIVDDKIETNQHPLFKEMYGRGCKGKPYVHNPKHDRELKQSNPILTEMQVKAIKEHEESRKVKKTSLVTINVADLMAIPDEVFAEYLEKEEKLGEEAGQKIFDEMQSHIQKDAQKKATQELAESIKAREAFEAEFKALEPDVMIEYMKLTNKYAETICRALLPMLKLGKGATEILEIFGDNPKLDTVNTTVKIYASKIN